MGNDEWNFETSSQASGKTQASPFDWEKVFLWKKMMYLEMDRLNHRR